MINLDMDKKVYNVVSEGRCTALWISIVLKCQRPEVSKSLQRLKRRGLVKHDVVWELSQPTNVTYAPSSA